MRSKRILNDAANDRYFKYFDRRAVAPPLES